MAITPVENPGEEGIDRRPLRPFEDAPTSIFGEDALSLGGGSEQAGVQLPVNKYLWRATLETLSFLPLSSTDPYGGVIISDWGATPEAPAERFKVTTFITSAVLNPQSLRVVVNRQQRDESGAWVAAPVSEETPRTLENAILVRARQLKVEAGDQDS